MSHQIIANPEPKLVLVTCLPAITATVFREFTFATEITTVWTTLMKTTDTNAETANAMLRRNSLAAPTNNGVI